jgi:HlyD family secretion protein
MNMVRGSMDLVKRVWAGPLWRRLLIACVPLLVILAVLWSYRSAGAVEYYTAQVQRGSVSQIVQATGIINPVVTVLVGSQVSGNISKLFVNFNDPVKAGQQVAQIDPVPFQAQLDQANADLANAKANVANMEALIDTEKADINVQKANVEKAQAQMVDAKTQWDRTSKLVAQGVLTAQNADDAKANYDSAVANIHGAQATLEQSNAKLKSQIAQRDQGVAQVGLKTAAAQTAALNLEHTKIFTPVDGTVILRNVDVGQTVQASLSAPTLYTIGKDMTTMQVYAKTDEADVGRIQVGGEATFRVDAFPRDTFNGKVSQVRMNATTVQNVVTYDTIVDFENPDMKLFPGMTAYVSIPVASETDVVKIPNGALRFKPDLSDSERDALFAKYKIPNDNAAGGGRGGNGAVAAGGGGDAGARRGGGGGRGNGGGAARGPRPAAGNRNDWGIVWKQLLDHSLQPIRVRQGITDFTFTAMEEGDLKVGDRLIIGQSTSTAAAVQQGRGAPLGPGVPGGNQFRLR